MPRELKSLPAVIAAAAEWEMTQEQLVDAIGKIRSSWSWGPTSDSEVAARVDTETKRKN